MPEPLMRQVFYWVAALFWLLCGLVQFNDPDPTQWIVFYAFGVYVTLRALYRSTRWWFPLFFAGLSSLYALRLFPQLDPSLSLMDDEIGRELMAVVLMGLWMLLVAVDLYRGRRQSE